MQKKGGEQSWMFCRGAEEHYFGSIVELPTTKTRDSAIGSILLKVTKRDLQTFTEETTR